MEYGDSSRRVPPPEVEELLAGHGGLTRQEHPPALPAPRQTYTNLPEVTRDRGYSTPAVAPNLSTQIAMEMRRSLGREAGKILTRDALEKVGLLLYAAAELDDVAESQPTERLARLAREIGDDYLEELGIGLKTQFYDLVWDMRYLLKESMVPNPPKQLTWKQRLGRKLLEG